MKKPPAPKKKTKAKASASDPLIREGQLRLIPYGTGDQASGNLAVALTRELFKLCANEGRFDLWEYAIAFLGPMMIKGGTAGPRLAAKAYAIAKETIRYDGAYGQED
jgi:hypothetical protein